MFRFLGLLSMEKSLPFMPIKSPVEGWAFDVVVKIWLGTPMSCIRACVLQYWFHSLFWRLANVYPGRQQMMDQIRGCLKFSCET